MLLQHGSLYCFWFLWHRDTALSLDVQPGLPVHYQSVCHPVCKWNHNTRSTANLLTLSRVCVCVRAASFASGWLSQRYYSRLKPIRATWRFKPPRILSYSRLLQKAHLQILAQTLVASAGGVETRHSRLSCQEVHVGMLTSPSPVTHVHCTQWVCVSFVGHLRTIKVAVAFSLRAVN